MVQLNELIIPTFASLIFVSIYDPENNNRIFMPHLDISPTHLNLAILWLEVSTKIQFLVFLFHSK